MYLTPFAPTKKSRHFRCFSSILSAEFLSTISPKGGEDFKEKLSICLKMSWPGWKGNDVSK